ncbi:hypothetical protein FQN55_000717 [Onygenales sp. PD_40]|nr:hypothetical protein FQN55_000717 [Onygenales sp. PD_40]
MCTEYATTSFAGARKIKQTYIKECVKKPRGKEPNECPYYLKISAGSSRKKPNLPNWAKKDKGGEDGDAERGSTAGAAS